MKMNKLSCARSKGEGREGDEPNTPYKDNGVRGRDADWLDPAVGDGVAEATSRGPGIGMRHRLVSWIVLFPAFIFTALRGGAEFDPQFALDRHSGGSRCMRNNNSSVLAPVMKLPPTSLQKSASFNS